jgi:CheY-like chemotaxis protein
MDPQARVIVATADIQDQTRQLVVAQGASAILNKPFTPETVLLTVQPFLTKDQE